MKNQPFKYMLILLPTLLLASHANAHNNENTREAIFKLCKLTIQQDASDLSPEQCTKDISSYFYNVIDKKLAIKLEDKTTLSNDTRTSVLSNIEQRAFETRANNYSKRFELSPAE